VEEGVERAEVVEETEERGLKVAVEDGECVADVVGDGGSGAPLLFVAVCDAVAVPVAVALPVTLPVPLAVDVNPFVHFLVSEYEPAGADARARAAAARREKCGHKVSAMAQPGAQGSPGP
jgi:hypothetical protein